MTTTPIPKIVLKNSTKLSLNERFTAYRQQAQAQTTIVNVRQKMQTQRQASVENRRLAQQMANRPSVIAALRIKKRSLQQRLGQMRTPVTPVSPQSNVKSRLNLNARRNPPVQGRLGGQRINPDRNNSYHNGFHVRGLKRKNRGGAPRPGTSPMLRARFNAKTTLNYNNRSVYRPRGGFNGNFRGRGRGFGRGGGQPAGQFRKHIANRVGIGAGGWNRGMRRKFMPTRQELDNQLDEYMAETRSHLDAQLDHYMSQGV